MNFLKSKSFWLGVLHVAMVAGSSYVAYSHGTSIDGVVAGGLTALAGQTPSLFSSGGNQQ